MDSRFSLGGNGASKGLVDVVTIAEGCVLFRANPKQPPPDSEMPLALIEVLPKWMLGNPVRIRTTLPIVMGGNTIGMYVWYERLGP